MFLLSLDEIDRVKRMNNFVTMEQLAEATGITRKTWSTAIRGRRPTPVILDALATLGARPNKILVLEAAENAA